MNSLQGVLSNLLRIEVSSTKCGYLKDQLSCLKKIRGSWMKMDDAYRFECYPSNMREYTYVKSLNSSDIRVVPHSSKFHIFMCNDKLVLSPKLKPPNALPSKHRYGFYEYTPKDPDEFCNLFFQNDGFENQCKRVAYGYYHRYSCKISPNVIDITVRRRERLIRAEVERLLDAYDIKYHRIQQQNDHMQLFQVFISSEESYNRLLNEQLQLDSKCYYAYPFYGASFQITGSLLHSKRCIQIYRRGSSFDRNHLVEWARLPHHIRISIWSYCNGHNHLIYTDNEDDFNRIRFNNGLPIEGDKSYIMCYYDQLRPSDLPSNRLLLVSPVSNLTKGSLNFQVVPAKFHVASSSKKFVKLFAADVQQYNQLLDSRVTHRRLDFGVQPDFSGFITLPDVLISCLRPFSEVINEEYIRDLFHPIPVESIIIHKGRFLLQFEPNIFLKALFSLGDINSNGLHFRRCHLSRIGMDTKSINILKAYLKLKKIDRPPPLEGPLGAYLHYLHGSFQFIETDPRYPLMSDQFGSPFKRHNTKPFPSALMFDSPLLRRLVKHHLNRVGVVTTEVGFYNETYLLTTFNSLHDYDNCMSVLYSLYHPTNPSQSITFIPGRDVLFL